MKFYLLKILVDDDGTIIELEETIKEKVPQKGNDDFLKDLTLQDMIRIVEDNKDKIIHA